jgi:hypothetical protein
LFSNDLTLEGDLFMGTTEPDQTIYFYDDSDPSNEFLRWEDSADRFSFSDDVNIGGEMSALTKNFRIDHPLDPENKYLYHSSVESPDMKTVYDGVVQLGEEGAAWVELPEYFQALNKDYRFQLTAVGAPAPNLHIADEIAENRFRIAGGAPDLNVCWQVTGIRRDLYANQNRTQVEVDKPEHERRTYIYPEGYADLAQE